MGIRDWAQVHARSVAAGEGKEEREVTRLFCAAPKEGRQMREKSPPPAARFALDLGVDLQFLFDLDLELLFDLDLQRDQLRPMRDLVARTLLAGGGCARPRRASVARVAQALRRTARRRRLRPHDGRNLARNGREDGELGRMVAGWGHGFAHSTMLNCARSMRSAKRTVCGSSRLAGSLALGAIHNNCHTGNL